MVGPGPFDNYDDLDFSEDGILRDFSESDYIEGEDWPEGRLLSGDDIGSEIRKPISELENKSLGYEVTVSEYPTNPSSGSAVEWQIANSPAQRMFARAERNFAGDPISNVRLASREFDSRFASLDLSKQQQAIRQFVSVQTERLRSVTSSFDESLRNRYGAQTQPSGFLRRPDAETYSQLFAHEQGQGMGLRMTYYQLQQRDVLQSLFNRQSSVEALAQGYIHKPAFSEEEIEGSKRRMDIALGNVISAGVLQEGAGFRKSIDLVNLEDGSFHPKMSYISEDVVAGSYGSSSVGIPYQTTFGTQNITSALGGRASTEELLVFNREVEAFHPVMAEIRAATDALLETQRRIKNSSSVGSFREVSSRLYEEITGRRQLDTSRRFVEMNERVQDRMLSILKDAARGNKRVVMSVQYLESLFREDSNSAGQYASFQQEMRGVLGGLAESNNLRVSMQAGRLGNRAGFYSAMDDYLAGGSTSTGGNLLRKLLEKGAIDFAPTMFAHSKSFAVFSKEGELDAFGMMSANVSRYASERNIETGLFFESGGVRDASEILREIDKDGGVSDYYLNVMSRGFSGGAGAISRFLPELKSDSTKVQSAFDRLSGLSGVEVSKRYRLPTEGERASGFEVSSLLSGVDISINRGQGSPFKFSVSVGSEYTVGGQAPVVYLNESGRAIVGSVYSNRSRYKVQIGNRVVAPGESVRLDAVEVLAGLVATTQKGIEFESRLGAVNDAYSSSFGGNKAAALSGLNNVLSRTFLSAAQMVTGGGFEVGTGALSVYDTLEYLRSELGERKFRRVVGKSRSLLETFAEGDMSEELKARLYPERAGGIDTLFSELEGGLPNRSVVGSALSKFEGVISDTTYGGEAFADLRRRVIDESLSASSYYQQRVGRSARDLFKQISASFFAPHELGYSASQALVNLPAFGITDEILHTLGQRVKGQGVINLDGAILSHDLLQHGMTLGESGEYARGIAATATVADRNIYKSLGAIHKAEGGAARVYETQGLFRMMPGLGIINRGDYLDDLSSLSGGDELLKVRFKELEEELFSINGNVPAGSPGVRETLLLLPYSKTEQISQRLKNLTSTRPALDISQETLSFLRNLGVGSRGSKDLVIGAEALTGAIRSSLPEHQYGMLRDYMRGLDPNLGIGERERLALEHFRERALDPTAVSKGVIGGSTPRRVLHNLGISTMSDFGYINSGYEKAYGYSHRVRVTFNPKELGSGQDTASVVRKVERALGSGVFAVARAMPLGDSANDLLRGELDKLRKDYRESFDLTESEATGRALGDLRSRFGRLNIESSGSDITASLRAGMYRIEGGSGGESLDPERMLNPELVGEFDEGGSSFSLLGVETYKGGRRSPVKVRLPAFSRREYGGITAFLGQVSSNVEGGKVTLQADTLNLMQFRSGLRPGEAAAKGPLLAIESDFFEMYNEIAQMKVLSGGVPQREVLPQRVRDEKIFAMLPRSAVKGFNFESGLALLEDIDEPGLMRVLKSSAGGEAVAQALGLLYSGSNGVQESLASSLGRRSSVQEMAIRLMNKGPKGLKKIDESLTGGAGGSVDKLAAVAGGIYSLADVSEGGSLSEALERTIRSALEINKETGDYTTRALRSQELLAERAYSLFKTVREEHSVELAGRFAFEEKGPVVKGASLMAYLLSISQQMFSSPNGSQEYGDRPMIELNLNPNYIYEQRVNKFKGRDREVLDEDFKQSTPTSRFIEDDDFRDRVKAIAMGLGLQLPRVENYTQLGDRERESLKREVEAKLQYMYSTFQMNRPLEVLMELSPSKSLVAAGMQDAVKLEYQYTTSMTAEVLEQYLPDSRTRDTVTDLQGAVLILSEAMNPSTRRSSLSELKAEAGDFRLSSLVLGEENRAALAAARISKDFSPITLKEGIRLGKGTTVLEDVLSVYTERGELDTPEFRRYEDFTNITQRDIGLSANEVSKRGEILSRVEASGVIYDPSFGDLTEGNRRRYASDFYDIFQRRQSLIKVSGKGQLSQIDASLSKGRHDYQVILSRYGDEIEREFRDGKLLTKESLFEVFEEKRVFDYVKDEAVGRVRSSVLDLYGAYERAEQSRAGANINYEPRGINRAILEDQDLRDRLIRNPVLELFTGDGDVGLFTQNVGLGGYEELERRQRDLIINRVGSYQAGVRRAIESSGRIDSGDNYIQSLEAIRKFAETRLRSGVLGRDESERLTSLKTSVEKTTYLELPSLEMRGESGGLLNVARSQVESPTVGIQLGLDVLQRMSLVFPDYTSDILLNQQRLRELQVEAAPLLKRLGQEREVNLTGDEIGLLTEMRQLMMQTTEDIRELATTDTVRQMLTDRMSAKGATFVPQSTFLAGRTEVGVGSKINKSIGSSSSLDRFIRSQYASLRVSEGEAQRGLAAQFASVLNALTRKNNITSDFVLGALSLGKGGKFVSAEGFSHRVVSGLVGERLNREGYTQALSRLEGEFYLGTALVNRGGAPAMVATTTAGTPIDVVSIDEISKRGKFESTYLRVDPKMGSTAMLVSAVSHNFTELGDYDGDMFQLVLTDIARLSAEITKGHEEFVLLERRLGERLNDDSEVSFVREQRDGVLKRINRTSEILKEKLQIQDAMRERSRQEGRAGVRQMVSAYTGLPGELFGEGRPISDHRSMTLVQQYRDTLSQMYDNAPNLEIGNRIIGALSQASRLEIKGDLIEGIDYSQLGGESDVELVRSFVRHSIETGRLQQGETNPQRIIQEFSTVHGAVANQQAMMVGINKGIENLQGQVMSENMFSNVQGAVGFAGSSLLGKTYNTIIPLMYATTQQLAIQRVLAREGPQGVFKTQLIENLRKIGASEEAINAAQRIQVGAGAAEAGQGMMAKIEQSIGFLGTMQQMMRDALKPKGDGGIGDAMVEFGLEHKLAQALDEQERAGVMKEFVLSKIGTDLEDPSGGGSNRLRQASRDRENQKTAFGLMYLLHEYATTESMDELMGYTGNGRKASVFAAELRDAYQNYRDEYKRGDLDGELLNKEDFTARLLSKQIARAQANFVAGSVIASAPDTEGLIKGINDYYLSQQSAVSAQIVNASSESERLDYERELIRVTGAKGALESGGLGGLIYHNLTEGGAGVSSAHVKYMREFGLMARELQQNKSFAGAIERNLEMGLLAANSMIQRGKAEPETMAGILTHLQEQIKTRVAASSMPELEGMNEQERLGYLYQSGYMRALNVESIFPELEKLPQGVRERVGEEFVRALNLPIDDISLDTAVQLGQESELSNGMKVDLTKYLARQVSAYEMALGLSSKFQTAKAQEAQAIASGDIEAVEVARSEAERISERESQLRSSAVSPAGEGISFSSGAIGNSVGVESARVSNAAAEIKYRRSSELSPQAQADISNQNERVESKVRATTSVVEAEYGRVRRRNDMAEVAGILAGPLAFGLMQGEVELDERAALFGLDVIQSMASMSQFEDSAVSTKLMSSGRDEEYQKTLDKRAREAAATFQYKRISNMMRNSDSSILGAMQGVATESMYQVLNMGVSRAARALEESSELVSKTVIGKAFTSGAAEIMGGVLAMSAARALLGEPITPREMAIEDEIDQILRYYSVQAYQQSEMLFRERMLENVTVEDESGEVLATDTSTDGSPSEIEIGIELGVIGYDAEDGHMIEISQNDSAAFSVA